MAAPTNAAKREESPCQPGAVHTWHETDMPKYLGDVRCWVNSGNHMLSLSFSGFDPSETSNLIASESGWVPYPSRALKRCGCRLFSQAFPGPDRARCL